MPAGDEADLEEELRLSLPSRPFLLPGPRGTGKTTWLRRQLPRALWYNLLLDRELLRPMRSPGSFRQEVARARRIRRTRRQPRVLPHTVRSRVEVDFVWSRGAGAVGISRARLAAEEPRDLHRPLEPSLLLRRRARSRSPRRAAARPPTGGPSR